MFKFPVQWFIENRVSVPQNLHQFLFFYFLSFLSRGHNLSFEHNQRRFCAHLKWYQSICSKKGKLKMKVEVIYKTEEIISRTFCRWWWVLGFGCHKMLWSRDHYQMYTHIFIQWLKIWLRQWSKNHSSCEKIEHILCFKN